MIIAGRAPMGGPRRKTVTLDRPPEIGGPLALTIQQLPLGFETVVPERLLPPQPRKSLAKKDGKVVRDQWDRTVQEVHTDDPAFRKAIMRNLTLQSVAFVYEALKGDPAVSFSVKEPPRASAQSAWEAFYGAVLEEMTALHFTSGEFRTIGDEALVLSGVKEGDLAEAREAFLPEAPPSTPAPATPSPEE